MNANYPKYSSYRNVYENIDKAIVAGFYLKR